MREVAKGTPVDELPILRDELDAIPDALVVSLGELVLSMLIQAGGPRKMINYWGYHRRWRSGLRVPMQAADPAQSTRAEHARRARSGGRSTRSCRSRRCAVAGRCS